MPADTQASDAGRIGLTVGARGTHVAVGESDSREHRKRRQQTGEDEEQRNQMEST